MLRSWLLFAGLCAATALGCADTLDDGGGAGPGGEGGGMECADQPCGTPCGTCDEPPCELVCDGQGECRGDWAITCTICPDYEKNLPRHGEDCPEVGLVCEYNDGLHTGLTDCRERVTCTVTGWDKMNGGQECYFFDEDASTCPMTRPTAGDACARQDYPDLCVYDEVTFCLCTNCLNGTCEGDSAWGCVYPPANDPCPDKAPQLGHACMEETLECTYGACWLELDDADGADLLSTRRVCEGGQWVEKSMGCE